MFRLSGLFGVDDVSVIVALGPAEKCCRSATEYIFWHFEAWVSGKGKHIQDLHDFEDQYPIQRIGYIYPMCCSSKVTGNSRGF